MRINGTPTERFWARVRGGDVTDCWIWAGSVGGGGYGSFWDGTRNVRAHRWAYEALIAPIPDGLQLDHLCRVRACVNPWHLEPVTGRVNTRRGEAGKHMVDKAAEAATCINGHPWIPENISISTWRGRPFRRCLACHRDNQRKRPCPVCGEEQRHLARHIRRRHEEVAA